MGEKGKEVSKGRGERKEANRGGPEERRSDEEKGK